MSQIHRKFVPNIAWEADFDDQVFEPRRDGNVNTDDVTNDKAGDEAQRPRQATSREAKITHENDSPTLQREMTSKMKPKGRTRPQAEIVKIQMKCLIS